MSKLNYCIECGEAVETDTFMQNFRRYDRGFWGGSGKEWDNPAFVVCINEDCRLYGVMMRRAKSKPPQRLPQEDTRGLKAKKKVRKNDNPTPLIKENI